MSNEQVYSIAHCVVLEHNRLWLHCFSDTSNHLPIAKTHPNTLYRFYNCTYIQWHRPTSTYYGHEHVMMLWVSGFACACHIVETCGKNMICCVTEIPKLFQLATILWPIYHHEAPLPKKRGKTYMKRETILI